MRVHVIQHVPFEVPGLIAEWALERGHTIEITRAWADEFPAEAGEGLLVVLGGPMGAADDDALPWLRPEKRFIAETIAARARCLSGRSDHRAGAGRILAA